MPAAVLFSLQPTLQKFHKPPVTMEGWFWWQDEEFHLQSEETTSAIMSPFRLKPLLKWVKRAEATISVDVWWRRSRFRSLKSFEGFDLMASKVAKAGQEIAQQEARQGGADTKFPRVQVTNFWMSASVTATASQTQTEELAWIPTCLWAVGVPPAAVPPWLPPCLPAVLPMHHAPLPSAPETRERREGDQSEGYLCFLHNVQCATFPLQQKRHREWWKNGCSSFLPKDLTQVKRLWGQTALKWFVELPEVKGQKDVNH